MELNIVLVEPQIPQNTGNIARTCAVTGARLHIVKPMGFQIDDKKLKHAGLDYWHYLDITYYDGLDDFFERNNDGEFFYFTTKGRNTYCDAEYKDKTYIVFGREDKGLPEELLFHNKQHCVRIPMGSNMRSLNLSNSVAIGAYEVLRQWGFPELQNYGSLQNTTGAKPNKHDIERMTERKQNDESKTYHRQRKRHYPRGRKEIRH